MAADPSVIVPTEQEIDRVLRHLERMGELSPSQIAVDLLMPIESVEAALEILGIQKVAEIRHSGEGYPEDVWGTASSFS